MNLLRINYKMDGSSKVFVAYFKQDDTLNINLFTEGKRIVSRFPEELELNDELYFAEDGQLRHKAISAPYPRKEWAEKFQDAYDRGDFHRLNQLAGLK